MAFVGISDTAGLRDVIVAVNGLADNLASDGTLNNVLAELQNILVELDSKVNENGTIQLAPDDIAALQMVTATILGQPTDYPDAASLAKLTGIANTLVDLLGETGDNGTMLANLLTDTELRATPLFVTDTRSNYPNSSADTKLDTLHADNGAAGTSSPSGSGILGWLRGIYDKLSALPTTIGLTDTQLRSSAVPVSGTVETNARPFSVNNQYSVSGSQLISAVVIPQTEAKGQFLTVKNISIGTGNSGVAFQMSEDGTNWYNVPSILLSNGGATFTTQTGNLGGTSAVYGFSVIGRYYRATLIAAQSAGTTQVSVTEFAAVPPLFAAPQNVVVSGVSISGSSLQTTTRGVTSTLTTFAATTTSATIAASNAQRKQLIIRNEGTADLYVRLGTPASAATYTYVIPTGITITAGENYTGIVTGITITGTATARVTEIT